MDLAPVGYAGYGMPFGIRAPPPPSSEPCGRKQKDKIKLQSSFNLLKVFLLHSEKSAKKDLSQLLATLSTQFGVQPFFTWTIGVNNKVSSESRV